MSLRIRRLELRVSTAQGLWGVRIPFRDGLVILRADNTRGKSTSLQAMAYGLGLEGMLGPSRDVPLPHAVTDFIDTDLGPLAVASSDVFLEIENATGEFLTIHRAIKGERARELITVWRGRALSSPESASDPADYFVRVSGGATTSVGFHRLLADFIGWSLPTVPLFTGGEGLLYMEALWPLLYVEQKTGWAAIEGRFPRHFRIREPGVRAVEYLLALDSRAIAERRANLRAALDAVRQEWAQVARVVDATAKTVGALVRGIPHVPTSDWPPAVSPVVLLPQQDEWIPIERVKQDIRDRVAALESQVVPSAEEYSSEAREQLRVSELALRDGERRIGQLLQEISIDRSEQSRVRERLEALEEDLARNKDARRLQNLGAVNTLAVAVRECPTCHQGISEALIPVVEDSETNPMTVSENVAYLEDQRKVFSFMLSEASRSIEARERQLTAERESADALRASIRSLKSTLVSDARLPSLAILEQRVRLLDRLAHLERAERAISDQSNVFTELAGRWAELQAELATLGSDTLTVTDEAKLARLERLFVEQLHEYGVESIDPNSLSISRDSFRPVYEDFDLQFDLSASDTIRAAWAYRAALLEVARAFETNHPGILLLDEPRQHDTSGDSFAALLRRLATTREAGQQVIVATSEPAASIDAMLAGVEASVVSFEGRILSRL